MISYMFVRVIHTSFHFCPHFRVSLFAFSRCLLFVPIYTAIIHSYSYFFTSSFNYYSFCPHSPQFWWFYCTYLESYGFRRRWRTLRCRIKTFHIRTREEQRCYYVGLECMSRFRYFFVGISFLSLQFVWRAFHFHICERLFCLLLFFLLVLLEWIIIIIIFFI